MNAALPVQIEAAYDRELLEAAARCYVKRFFLGSGRWLLAACVVNVLGFVAALALGAELGLVMAWVAFIVAIGPLYCGYLLLVFPPKYASRATRLLAPTTRISLGESTVEFFAKDRASPVPWRVVKAVWDCPPGFLLVISQFVPMFIVIPKNGLPLDAQHFLMAKVSGHVG